ncbi:hypothetical protein K456DRAFT_1595189 [Colletotrichum gloeosporioides 23]|nr:hypothetical protein K456DRAFT_1595189 [Colletotrichum gloeosporioides 23]
MLRIPKPPNQRSAGDPGRVLHSHARLVAVRSCSGLSQGLHLQLELHFPPNISLALPSPPLIFPAGSPEGKKRSKSTDVKQLGWISQSDVLLRPWPWIPYPLTASVLWRRLCLVFAVCYLSPVSMSLSLDVCLPFRHWHWPDTFPGGGLGRTQRVIMQSNIVKKERGEGTYIQHVRRRCYSSRTFLPVRRRVPYREMRRWEMG